MARKRGSQKKSDDVIEGIPALPALRRVSDESDPRESSDGAVADFEKPVTGKAVRMDGALDSKRLLIRYGNNLVAFKGDKVKALAETFNLTEEQATENMIALHDRIVGASKVSSDMSSLVEDNDLGLSVRLAKLREMMFSDIPAVALKAIDMVNDLDATMKSKRIGMTWDQLVVKWRENAARDMKRRPKEV